MNCSIFRIRSIKFAIFSCPIGKTRDFTVPDRQNLWLWSVVHRRNSPFFYSWSTTFANYLLLIDKIIILPEYVWLWWFWINWFYNLTPSRISAHKYIIKNYLFLYLVSEISSEHCIFAFISFNNCAVQICANLKNSVYFKFEIF